MFLRFSLSAVVIAGALAFGCGGNVVAGPGSGGAGGSTGGGGSGDIGGGGSGGASTAGTGGSGGVTEVQCSGSSAYFFPTFDKSCAAVQDCIVRYHTTDCCGNSLAIGLNASEAAAFDAAEAICDAQYPPCGCAGGPPVAEDGDTVLGDDPALVCDGGQCMTYVP